MERSFIEIPVESRVYQNPTWNKAEGVSDETCKEI